MCQDTEKVRGSVSYSYYIITRDQTYQAKHAAEMSAEVLKHDCTLA